MSRFSFFLMKSLLLYLPCLTGCSVFFGNIRPLEKKSSVYSLVHLAEKNPEWTELTPETFAEDYPESFDRAFQSSKTDSIISVNSTCYPSDNKQLMVPLETLTEQLIQGTSDLVVQEQTLSKTDQTPSLVTVSRGRMKGRPVVMKTVVLKKENCLYDLIYIAKPSFFKADEPTFEAFILSLKIK